MRVWSTSLLLLAACGGPGIPLDTHGDDDDTPIDTSVAFPVWRYQYSPASARTTLYAGGAEAGHVDGVSWDGSFGGPAFVAETEQELQVTLTNVTSGPFDLEFPGVEVVQSATWPVASAATAILRTTGGPGVWIWAAPEGGQASASSGLFGLITARDPDEFPVEELDEQVNLVFVDPPASSLEVDGCVVGSASTGAACPDWVPAPEGFGAVMVTQRLILNPAFREGLRHGGPPNEFLTSTVSSLSAGAGDDVRVNVGSLSAEPHTVSLGGLTWTDPVSGETRDTFVLEPGATGRATLPAIPAGTYELGCVDHDHHGFGQVTLTVGP